MLNYRESVEFCTDTQKVYNNEKVIRMNKQKTPRAKRLILAAFENLLESVPFEKITVRMITDKAEVSRGAFYFYYFDKYALMEEVQTYLLNGLRNLFKKNVRNAGESFSSVFNSEHKDDLYSAMLQYFMYLQDNHHIMELLLSERGDAAFIGRFQNMLINEMKETQQKWGSTEEEAVKTIGVPSREYLAVFHGVVYHGIFSYWLQSGMTQTPETMAKMLAHYWVKNYNALS